MFLNKNTSQCSVFFVACYIFYCCWKLLFIEEYRCISLGFRLKLRHRSHWILCISRNPLPSDRCVILTSKLAYTKRLTEEAQSGRANALSCRRRQPHFLRMIAAVRWLEMGWWHHRLRGPHKTHSLKLFWQGVSNSKFSDSYPHLPFEQPRNSPKPCFQIVKNGGKSAFETFICVRREIARIYIESGYGKRKEFAEALNFCCYSHAFRPSHMSINWLNVAEKLHKKPTDSSILLTLLLQLLLLQLLFLMLLELSWFLFHFWLVFNWWYFWVNVVLQLDWTWVSKHINFT